MGLLWNKTVIAFTFADALPVARAVRQDPSYSQAKYFDERLTEWTNKLAALLRERFSVKKDSVPMVSTTDNVQEALPNHQLWYCVTNHFGHSSCLQLISAAHQTLLCYIQSVL